MFGMKQLFLGLSSVILFSTAFASMPEACLRCQNINQKDKFVECMEKCLSTQKNEKQPIRTVAKLSVKQLKQKVQNAGWSVKIHRERMDDVQFIYVYKESRESIGRYGYSVKPLLYFVQLPKTKMPTMMIETGDVTLDPLSGWSKFKVRVDNNRPFTIKGEVLPQGKGKNRIAFVNTLPPALLQQILDGSEILIEIQTLGSGNEYLSWSLNGSTAVFQYLYPDLIPAIQEALNK